MALTLEEGVYYHYLTSPIFRWETACNGVCSEAFLELVLNPFGIGSITQVINVDMLRIILMSFLIYPLSIIYILAKFSKAAAGIIAKLTFDTFSDKRP